MLSTLTPASRSCWTTCRNASSSLAVSAGLSSVQENVLAAWLPAVMGGMRTVLLRPWCELEKDYFDAAAQEVVKARSGGSPVELEAARKQLSQVQFEQTEKLKEVAAHLQLQLAAFQQLKAAATNAPK